MIDGNIKESLNLVGVQVHGNQPVDARCAQHIGHQLGTDGNTGFILAVLAGPSEIRHHCYDFIGRCSLGSINHQQ